MLATRSQLGRDHVEAGVTMMPQRMSGEELAESRSGGENSGRRKFRRAPDAAVRRAGARGRARAAGIRAQGRRAGDRLGAEGRAAHGLAVARRSRRRQAAQPPASGRRGGDGRGRRRVRPRRDRRGTADFDDDPVALHRRDRARERRGSRQSRGGPRLSRACSASAASACKARTPAAAAITPRATSFAAASPTSTSCC